MSTHHRATGGCPFKKHGADESNLSSASLSATERLASQIAPLLSGYTHDYLPLEIARLEQASTTALTEEDTATDPSLNLCRVNAVISFFAERACGDLLKWVETIDIKTGYLPLIDSHELRNDGTSLQPFSYRVGDVRAQVKEIRDPYQRIKKLSDLLLLTAKCFLGPSGNYGTARMARFTQKELLAHERYDTLPKYNEGKQVSNINSDMMGGLETGVSVMSKIAVVNFLLLRNHFDRAPSECEFKDCFLASQDFLIDMMTLPLQLATHLEHALKYSAATSLKALEFFDQARFAVEGSQNRLFVGLRKGVITELADRLPLNQNSSNFDSSRTHFTKCPFLFTSDGDEPMVYPLAKWVSNVLWAIVFSDADCF
jgi:hypothetical protein